jgi:formylglycine-generating enzyme required for sulfatase activity
MEQHPKYHTETVNGHTFRMRYLPGGVFKMGDDNAVLALGAEGPIHKVELSPYYIGDYLVTQGLWKQVMGRDNNPSRFIGKNRPVECVSWLDVVKGNQNGNGQPAFLQELNEATKTSRPAGYKYRLPTEAEWECAARGSRQNRISLGRNRTLYEYAGSDELKEVGWFDENSHGETKTVGLKHPNTIGLYDMSGNVEEWCLDIYSSQFFQDCYTQGVVKDPICLDDQVQGMVLRGAGFKFPLPFCRLSYRGNWFSDYRDSSVGFRLALAKVHTDL